MKKLLQNLGITPLVTGVVDIVREKNDPNGKISGRRAAAAAMIGTAITLATSGGDKWYVILFAACGTALLVASSFNGRKSA